MEPARAGRCARLVQQRASTRVDILVPFFLLPASIPRMSGLSPSAPCGVGVGGFCEHAIDSHTCFFVSMTLHGNHAKVLTGSCMFVMKDPCATSTPASRRLAKLRIYEDLKEAYLCMISPVLDFAIKKKVLYPLVVFDHLVVCDGATWTLERIAEKSEIAELP
ncbi:hypothetical protein BDP81DRAFT_418229 [Colletotrichum phormii]|uniref:Uncharacterized protein n=1 Tax=Colletotrichum phormii TaxID=359342 RepID=A0AAJ0A0H1_9PEZI|nr:uncharacterized protein BDP81DRAFT_418229 [Colletotrichum phormii]KAK1641175.1 hypothetical protein BDP81DRAFT_418229 [Colletotrichum phormii]